MYDTKNNMASCVNYILLNTLMQFIHMIMIIYIYIYISGFTEITLNTDAKQYFL